jgi:ApaG protein
MATYIEVSKIPAEIRVEVEPKYVPERSNPSGSFFFFAYQVKIQNIGETPCRLLGRHWIIRDGHGAEEHVRGDGVVGEQPWLQPGESFSYTSFCPLGTPTGNMRGCYLMVDSNNNNFEVKIPLFFLRSQTRKENVSRIH